MFCNHYPPDDPRYRTTAHVVIVSCAIALVSGIFTHLKSELVEEGKPISSRGQPRPMSDHSTAEHDFNEITCVPLMPLVYICTRRFLEPIATRRIFKSWGPMPRPRSRRRRLPAEEPETEASRRKVSCLEFD